MKSPRGTDAPRVFAATALVVLLATLSLTVIEIARLRAARASAGSAK